VPRFLALAIFAYARLSVAQWCSVIQLFHGPADELRSGNVISDPQMLLVNVLGPVAGAANVALVGACMKSRRWPAFVILASFTFAFTPDLLAYEGYRVTHDRGLPLDVPAD
jgi:hypothetical protein